MVRLLCDVHGRRKIGIKSPRSQSGRLRAHADDRAISWGRWAASRSVAAAGARCRPRRAGAGVSLAYTLGFLLLNCSLGRLQASFSETVRGLEPLTSFVLVRLLSARGGQLSGASAAALLSVLAGAALSVWAQPAFDLKGFAFGLLANCCFSSRALLVTLLQDAQKSGVDPIGLFAAQHSLGLLLLAPAALAAEGTQCAVVLASHPKAAHAAGLSALGFLAYNFLSLYVLLLIDAVSHSVCNTCRRAVTIVAAAIIFQNAVSPTSAAGIVLIIGGATAYAIASAAAKNAAGRATTARLRCLRQRHAARGGGLRRGRVESGAGQAMTPVY